MPYEVVKTVNGRHYRYRVERYRDPQSGKMKARWSYLGRAGAEPPRKRSRAESTREHLIKALTDLVERRPWNEMTVDAIANEAGVAHGTVYRHFTDRWDVLRAALAQRRGELERERPAVDGPLGSREDERRRLRAWVVSVVSLPLERPGLVAAYAALTAEFESDDRRRRSRRAQARQTLQRYLERLADAQLIPRPRDPEPLCIALFIALEGLYRGPLRSTARSKTAIAQGFIDLFDRAVFGEPVFTADSSQVV